MTHQEVVGLYEEYLAGVSRAELGARLGRSHEYVRQLFQRHGLRILTQRERAAQRRTELQRQAEERREEIISLYKRHGTLPAVVAEVELPHKLVSAIVDQIPNREAYRRRGVIGSYDRETLIAHLKQAAELKGEPLTIPAYREAATELGLAAWNTQIRVWQMEDPEHPWLAGLDAAGIQGNEPRGRRASSITAPDCVAAVRRCIQAHGERVSYAVYERWAREHGEISGSSINLIIGWNYAVEEALDSQ